MTLSDKQKYFARMMTVFEAWVYSHPGWEMTDGEAHRPEEMAEIYAKMGIGIKDSLHSKRLARDKNFFINGVYQQETEAYRPLGEFWKSLDPNNRWGGDFHDSKGKPKPDGNHFEYAG